MTLPKKPMPATTDTKASSWAKETERSKKQAWS